MLSGTSTSEPSIPPLGPTMLRNLSHVSGRNEQTHGQLGEIRGGEEEEEEEGAGGRRALCLLACL